MRTRGKYSQGDEDSVIKEFFGDYTGVLLSLGENDGITLSNSRLLIENGWEAFLVEPSPKAFERLSELYKDDPKVQCINVAIGTECCTMTLYESGNHLNCNDTSLLSSLLPHETERWRGTEFNPVDVTVIDVATLLLTLPADQIDFVSIDCEGFDLDILQQFDFQAIGTKLVCVEWNSKDKELFDAIMLPQGFKLIHTTPENLLYAL